MARQGHQLEQPPRGAGLSAALCRRGTLLLTHSHAIANIKDQLLIELTHTPLALAGIAAGWGRWLEIRLNSAEEPGCMAGRGLGLARLYPVQRPVAAGLPGGVGTGAARHQRAADGARAVTSLCCGRRRAVTIGAAG